MWELETGQLLHSLEGHSNRVNAVAITSDGMRAISGSYDRTLKVWELKTGKLLHSLEGHSNWINAVAVIPDGRQAVSASEDGTLKVWELETAKPIDTFTADGALTVCTVLPDGTMAVAGDSLGRIHFLCIEERR